MALVDAQKTSIKVTYAYFFTEKNFQDKLVIKDEIEKKSHWGLPEYSHGRLVLFVPQASCLHCSELKVFSKKKSKNCLAFTLFFHSAQKSCYYSIYFSTIGKTICKKFWDSYVILSLTMFTLAGSVAPTEMDLWSQETVGPVLLTPILCVFLGCTSW